MPHPSPANPDFEASVRESFRSQPAMALIGAELARIEPGLCEIQLPCRSDLMQQDGFIHGGVVGMIADSAAGYAGYTLMPAGSSVLTVEYKMNLLAPGRGERLVARGRVHRRGRTLTVAQADVFACQGGQEILCATMLQTLICLEGGRSGR